MMWIATCTHLGGGIAGVYLFAVAIAVNVISCVLFWNLE
jgi:hypothetical protein